MIAVVRIEYEREHGRVASSGDLLQLVAFDPTFAWLHPLSELIVQLDELVETVLVTETETADGAGERRARLLSGTPAVP